MGKLFGGGSDVKMPDPVRMPNPSDANNKAQQDNVRRRLMARSGRASTRLSSDQPGTSTYRNSLLGQG